MLKPLKLNFQIISKPWNLEEKELIGREDK